MASEVANSHPNTNPYDLLSPKGTPELYALTPTRVDAFLAAGACLPLPTVAVLSSFKDLNALEQDIYKVSTAIEPGPLPGRERPPFLKAVL